MTRRLPGRERRRVSLATAAFTVAALAGPLGAVAAPAPRDDAAADILKACLAGASKMHGVPPSALVVLLMVEAGRLGMRTPNKNGTGDLGPLQINEAWVPQVAAHWKVSEAEAYTLLRDDLCSNTEAAAWILAQARAEAHGDLWGGVARYHSANPAYQLPYLQKALAAAQSLLRSAAAPREAPR